MKKKKHFQNINKWFIEVQKDILYNIVIENWEQKDFEDAFKTMTKHLDHYDVLMQIYYDSVSHLALRYLSLKEEEIE